MDTIALLLMKIRDSKAKVCTHKVISLYFSSVLSKEHSVKETVNETAEETVNETGKKTAEKRKQNTL